MDYSEQTSNSFYMILPTFIRMTSRHLHHNNIIIARTVKLIH